MFKSIVSLALIASLTNAAVLDTEQRGRGGFKQKIGDLKAKFDTDGDGTISAEERQAARSQVVGKLDTNGDGQVDKTEKQAAIRNKVAKTQARDGDRRAAYIAKFDTDGDGTLNEEEKEAAKAARAEKYGKWKSWYNSRKRGGGRGGRRGDQ